MLHYIGYLSLWEPVSGIHSLSSSYHFNVAWPEHAKTKSSLIYKTLWSWFPERGQFSPEILVALHEGL